MGCSDTTKQAEASVAYPTLCNRGIDPDPAREIARPGLGDRIQGPQTSGPQPLFIEVHQAYVAAL